MTMVQKEEIDAASGEYAMLETLVAAAIRAPSGDNTQPWRFVVHGDNRIAVYVDEARDASPMNAGQRMARIACGAAIENMLHAAGARHWSSRLQAGPSPALAVVAFDRSGDGDKPDARIEDSIIRRVTNRRLYDGRPASDKLLARLQDDTPILEGVSTHWICGLDRISRLAAVIGQADAVMFGQKSLRRAFLAQVRFDAPYDASVEEGLSLGSLEVSGAEILAMRTVFRGPNWLYNLSGAPRIVAAHARKRVESASGLCVIAAPPGPRSPYTDLVVGRAMQRAWLALHNEGLAVQPMMSLLVLENLVDHAHPTISSAGREQSVTLLNEFRALVPEAGAGRPAFLVRFGFAHGPSGRTGRRPLTAVSSMG